MILTQPELEATFGKPFTHDGWLQALEVVQDVEGELSAWLDRPIEVETVVGEVHELTYETQQLFLDKTPVVSIEQVSINGQALTAPIWEVTRWGLDLGATSALAMADPVIWTPSAWAYSSVPPDVYALATGTIPSTVYAIDYHGGLDGPNIRAIKSILKKAVRRELASYGEGLFGGGDYTRMSVEDYTIQKNERLILQKQGSFTTGDLRILEKYRRKRVGI